MIATMSDKINLSARTALCIIDNQCAFQHPTYWGSSRSNPSFEANITLLLQAFRSGAQQKPNDKPLVIHVLHHSVKTTSVLHPSHRGPYGPDGEQCLGVDEQHYTAPLENSPCEEIVIIKHSNSGLIGTDMLNQLRDRLINTLIIAGLTTDHCVSTTTRMAANYAELGDWGRDDTGMPGHPRIIFVEDATTCHAKGGFDALTVHRVNVESLGGEFAEILSTEEIVAMLKDGHD